MTLNFTLHGITIEEANQVLESIPKGKRGRLVLVYDTGEDVDPWLEFLDRHQPEVVDDLYADVSEVN